MARLSKTLMRNTVTNYIYLGTYLVSAIFMARILLLGLGENPYGFWTLLWAVFGYSLLLDFGFGKTVVKFTAEYKADGDIKRYSQIISSVFICYLIMSVILIIASAFLTYFYHLIFQVKDMLDQNGQLNVRYYKFCFMIFAIGIAAVFPSGIIPEILVGLKRFDLKNYVLIVNTILNLVGVWVILHYGGWLLSLSIFTAVLNILTNLVMAVFVFKLVPGLKISLFSFKLSRIKEIADFSIFAYILTMANLVIFKTDRIVLGVMSGIAMVAVYQIGTRVSDLMKYASSQFQSNISPVTAELHRSGETQRLSRVMLKSTRISAFICGCAFIVCFISAPQILKIWLKVVNPQAVTIARIMLASALFEVMFKSVAEGYILMINKHRIIAIVTVFEAILNITLSVLLVYMYGVVGVAWGTLIPSVFLCVFVIFPLFAQYSGTSIIKYLTNVYLPVALISILPALLMWYAWEHITIHQVSTLSLIGVTGGAGLLYSLLGALFFFSRNEREILIDAVPQLPGFAVKIIRHFPCFVHRDNP